jgi:large subunit ribosomal protein L30
VKIRITLKRSRFGRRPDHVATIRALGLRRLNSSIVKDDTPQIRGMIKKVGYLLSVDKVESDG